MLVSFVPGFDPKRQEGVFVDSEPEYSVTMNASDFLYVFIVDRSSSMEGKRISLAIDAMKLFIKSLPPQCKFQIISFGSSYDLMSIRGQ